MFNEPSTFSVVSLLLGFVRFPGSGDKLVSGTEEMTGTCPVSPIRLVPSVAAWLGGGAVAETEPFPRVVLENSCLGWRSVLFGRIVEPGAGLVS